MLQFRIGRITLRAVKLLCYIALIAGAASRALADSTLWYTGVSLAGAEFGNTPTPGNTGTFGHDYTYPTSQEVDHFISKGLNTFRLPFRWERLQPTAGGPLNSTEFNRLNNFVTYATSHGATVILDPHNYGRYYPDPNDSQGSAQGLVGSAVPNSAFADLWSQLATDYKGNSNVVFGLMNEPANEPTEQWVGAANSAIAAIRAAGANNLILVPGNAWTGAASWSDNWYGTPNAQAMLSISDPGHNFAIEVHLYLDPDGSGGSAAINNNDPMTGVQRLTGFTQWLEAHNLKGFLGEFAAANSTMGTGATQIGDETINNMINYMQAHGSAWLGYTWWAAGPWWGEYQFTLEPTNLGKPGQTDRPALATLGPHLAGIHIAGDTNADHVVNGLDISQIASHWLDTGAGACGDANHDGVVNGLDIAVVASNWLHQSSAAASATAVPEPGTCLLAALGGIVAFLNVRRGLRGALPTRRLRNTR